MDIFTLLGIGASIATLCIKIKSRFNSHSPSDRPIPRSPSPAQRHKPQERQDSTTSRQKKQFPKNMKRIAVKKNDQHTFYRVNKYGEIFEETNK